MDGSQSTRSCSRARTSRSVSQRGFALLTALALAVLYFGLVELLLIDSSRQLAEARHFRARIVALTIAENGAELAARGLVSNPRLEPVRHEDDQGLASGQLQLMSDRFVIEASGETAGVVQTKARVTVIGAVDGENISIQYTMH